MLEPEQQSAQPVATPTPRARPSAAVKEAAPELPSGSEEGFDLVSRTKQSYQQFQGALRDIQAGSGMELNRWSLFSMRSACPLHRWPEKASGSTKTRSMNTRPLAAGKAHSKLGATEPANRCRHHATAVEGLCRHREFCPSEPVRRDSPLAAQRWHWGGRSLADGDGQKLDPATARIFLQLTAGDKDKARQAASRKGWSF